MHPEEDLFLNGARQPMLLGMDGQEATAKFMAATSTSQIPLVQISDDSPSKPLRHSRTIRRTPNPRRFLQYLESSSREHFVSVKRISEKIKPENLLLLFTIIAVILGTIIGLSLNPMLLGRELSVRERYYLGFLGDWFLRMLKMLIIPMVISSNISSIASLNNVAARWLAALSIAYYFLTALIAVVLGILIVLIIQPGNRGGRTITSMEMQNKGALKLFDSLLYAFRNLIPESILKATSSFEHDVLNVTGNLIGDGEPQRGQNILGPIVVSIMFGVAIRNLKDEAAILAEFFHSVRRTMVYLVSIIMWISPLGIFSLIAQNIALESKLVESLQMLSLYVATVITGLAVHGIIVLPSLLHIVTKRSPLIFTKNMLQALICAAGTASSTATLPCTVKCLEKETSVDHRVTKFMLPLGTTINMDGTIMYEAIAVIYIAQRMNVDLFIDDIFLIAVTSILAGMGAASMPSAGILTMTMVLMAIGIHPSRTMLILPVDWFLDRFRTMVNVYGDTVGAAIVSKLCEPKLKSNSIADMDEALPHPNDTIMTCSGGLQGDVDIAGRRKSLYARRSYGSKRTGNGTRTAILQRPNGGICRVRSRAFSKDDVIDPMSPRKKESEPSQACVYVIDDNTVIFTL